MMIYVLILCVLGQGQTRADTKNSSAIVTQGQTKFIQDLYPQHGIIFRPLQDKCFPSEFIIIQGIFPFGALLSQIGNEFTEFRAHLGKYHSSQDTTRMKDMYYCSTEELVNNTCPESALTFINDTYTNYLRHQSASIWNQVLDKQSVMLTLLGHVDNVHGKPLIPGFPLDFLQMLGNETQEQAPLILNATQEQLLKQRGYSVMQLGVKHQFSRTFLEAMTITKMVNNNLVINNTGSDLTKLNRLLRASTDVATIYDQMLNSLENALANLLDNKMPYQIMALEDLDAIFVGLDNTGEKGLSPELQRVFSVDHILPLIRHLKTTSITTNCIEADCTTRSYTFMPVPKLADRYYFKQILTIPIADSTSYGKMKWKKMQDVPHYVLHQGQKAITTHDLNAAMTCYDTSIDLPCDICTPIIMRTHDNCVGELLGDASQMQSCTFVEVEEPPEEAFVLDGHQYAFTDPDSGTIVQQCDTKRAVEEIPPSGILSFQPQCTYEMVDGPIGIKPVGIDLRLFDDIKKINIPNLIKDLTDLHQHFQQYSPIYIISLVCSIAAVICGTGMYCICKWKNRRSVGIVEPNVYRYRLRREPTIREERELSIELQPMRAIAPARPPLPNRNRSPQFVLSGTTITEIA